MTEEKHTADQAEDQELLDQTEQEQPMDDDGKIKGEKHDKKGKKESKKLAELEAEVAELKDKYLRLYAEFDNYKKRTIREKLDLMRTAAQDTLTSLLPLLDDFDRAKKIADDPATEESFSDGVEMVYNKLYATLKILGLNAMESTGQEFDAEKHEAITEIPAPTEEMKGKVVDTIEKGYLLQDKIIRHAKVVIGR